MSKNINVEAHLKRYEHTELPDIVALIEGLQSLVDTRRGETITKLKEKLAILEAGGTPQADEKPAKAEGVKRTRGGKKTAAAEEA